MIQEFCKADPKALQVLSLPIGKFHAVCPHMTEIYFVKSGVLKLWISGEPCEGEEGDILISDCDEVRFSDTDCAEVLVVRLGIEYVQPFKNAYPGKRMHSVLRDKEYNRSLLRKTELWGKEYAVMDNVLRNIGYANLLIADLVMHYPPEDRKLRPGNIAIGEILDYIEQNYHLKLTLDGLAERYGYAKEYCSTIFNRCTGENLKTYVNRLRVRAVHAALVKDPRANAVETARRFGFESAATFYRAYLKEYGVNPKGRLLIEKSDENQDD